MQRQSLDSSTNIFKHSPEELQQRISELMHENGKVLNEEDITRVTEALALCSEGRYQVDDPRSSDYVLVESDVSSLPIKEFVKATGPDNNHHIYGIIRKIGKGGLGTIELMQDLATGEFVVLKSQQPSTSHGSGKVSEADLDTLVEREKKAINIFNNGVKGNFIRSRRLAESELEKSDQTVETMNEYNIIMDFVPGKTLSSIMLEQKGKTVSEKIPVAAAVIREVMRILDNGFIHGDLNPNNIIYNPSTQKATLVDFSNTREIIPGQTIPALPGALTPAYAAPEILYENEKNILTESYAVGVMLLELFELGTVTLAGKIIWKHEPADNEAKNIYHVVKNLLAAKENRIPLSKALRNLTAFSLDVETSLNKEPKSRGDRQRTDSVATSVAGMINQLYDSLYYKSITADLSKHKFNTCLKWAERLNQVKQSDPNTQRKVLSGVITEMEAAYKSRTKPSLGKLFNRDTSTKESYLKFLNATLSEIKENGALFKEVTLNEETEQKRGSKKP